MPFILGDSKEEIMKLDDCVDFTITSPPYNKRKNNYAEYNDWDKQRSGNDLNTIYKNHDDNLSQEDYENEQVEILNALYDKTTDNGFCFYNHKNNIQRSDNSYYSRITDDA